MLFNIPLKVSNSSGISMPNTNITNLARIRQDSLSELQVENMEETSFFVEAIFQAFVSDIHFDEFLSINKRVTCELFFGVFHIFYHYIPLAQNYFIMKTKFDSISRRILNQLGLDGEIPLYGYHRLQYPELVLKRSIELQVK